MEQTQTQNITVVLSSCDRYADLLQPFSTLFRRHWSDCRYPVMLVTETEAPCTDETVFSSCCASPKGTSWCEILLKGIRRVQTPYVLLLLDDYFMCGDFSTAQAEHYVDVMRARNAGFLLLTHSPIAQKKTEEPGILECERGTAYRINASAALWKREYLIAVLEKAGVCTAWNFERIGEAISAPLPECCLGTDHDAFPYLGVCRVGKYTREGMRLICKEKVQVDREKRPVASVGSELRRHITSAVFCCCPTLIVKVQLFLERRKKKK